MAKRHKRALIYCSSPEAEEDIESSYGCDITSTKRLKPCRRYCPHCNQELSYKTYRTHKRLHYNCDTSSWCKDVDEVSSSESVPQTSPCASAPSYDSNSILTAASLRSPSESPPHFHHDFHPFSDSSTTLSSNSDHSSGMLPLLAVSCTCCHA